MGIVWVCGVWTRTEALDHSRRRFGAGRSDRDNCLMRDFRHRPLNLHAIAQTQLRKARRVDWRGAHENNAGIHTGLGDVLGQLERFFFHTSLSL